MIFNLDTDWESQISTQITAESELGEALCYNLKTLE